MPCHKHKGKKGKRKKVIRKDGKRYYRAGKSGLVRLRATAIDSDVTVTVRTRPTRNRKKLGRKKRNGPHEARPIFSREKEAEWAARSAAEVF